MALEIPETAIEVENRSLTDVQRELQESNPRLKNSWLLALIASSSNRIFDFYLQLLEAIKQNFPDTATDEFLEQWADIWGKQRQAATQATGNCVASGTATSVIPLGTTLTASGETYTTTSSGTISDQSIGVTSPDGIVRSGQTATVTTLSNHNLASNVAVTITGADQTEYNVIDAEITVTGLDTFEYQVVGTPATPATPSAAILVGFTSASIPIQSDEFGSDQNLETGTLLKLQSPIAGVDDNFGVDFGAIGGGTDQETDVSLRERMLDKIQNPVAHFNDPDITDKAKEVAGVTRVFVQRSGTIVGTASIVSISNTAGDNVATAILATPQDLNSGQLVTITGASPAGYNVTDAPILVENTTTFQYIIAGPLGASSGTILSSLIIPLGTLKVYFMRDNDVNPIPSGSEVTTVKNKILEIDPANTDVSDLGVFAPTAVPTDYVFDALTPNTQTMKNAITANLDLFYAEGTFVGVNIDEDAYRSTIFNTVDTETGDTVLTFSLTEPIGDIPIGVGEIGTRGNVTFSI